MRQAFADGAIFGTAEGPTPWRVVALPGWMHTADDFSPMLAELATGGVGAAALDLPGFGGATPEPSQPAGGRGYVDLVDPVLADPRLGTGPLVVVGHSFGGRVAVGLAARHPERVAALVLAGVPLFRREPAQPPPLAFRLARWANRRGIFPDDRMERLRRQHGSADYRNATGVMRDVLVMAVNESYETEIEDLRCPVELVWGADDDQAPVSLAERAADLLGSRARLTVLPSVGHQVPTEAPAALAAAVIRVLP